ncbi:choice-of-anchor tandem repeat GloVer-containing protein [Sphingomicrobium arenosum]|uniref:choice-of-anchor tandem repeat GloVer-containing protein n=1 Tax=Sphingomicrobium arenosum TaxID=2233861 RepID=UPI002240FF15|nr:choice-of-anchor tandem repeat GloVer-containing protein [Sphingomicrobium arenosum]
MGVDLKLVSCLAILFGLSGCGGGGTSKPVPPPTQGPAPAPSPAPAPDPQPEQMAIEFYDPRLDSENRQLGLYTPLLGLDDGYVYGMATRGGAGGCYMNSDCGMIFRMDREGNVERLHRFSGADGFYGRDHGHLIEGSDGALYGTTLFGGADDRGVVFRITSAGSYTVLHEFKGGGDEGQPIGSLVEHSDGYLYGTTNFGPNICDSHPEGSVRCGTIYRVSKDGEYQVVHAFGRDSDPMAATKPNGTLVEGPDGALYGTARGGKLDCRDINAQDGSECGTIFRYDPKAGFETVYHFGDPQTQGTMPRGPLIVASDGYMYGTTPFGASVACRTLGCGTVYKFSTDGRVEFIHRFILDDNGELDHTLGYTPGEHLVEGADGYLYGATVSGGFYRTSDNGTIFRLSKTGEHDVLHSFGPHDTSTLRRPVSGLMRAPDGGLWGTFDAGDNIIFRVQEPSS